MESFPNISTFLVHLWTRKNAALPSEALEGSLSKSTSFRKKKLLKKWNLCLSSGGIWFFKYLSIKPMNYTYIAMRRKKLLKQLSCMELGLISSTNSCPFLKMYVNWMKQKWCGTDTTNLQEKVLHHSFSQNTKKMKRTLVLFWNKVKIQKNGTLNKIILQINELTWCRSQY